MATRLAYTLLALMACCHCAAQLTIEECYAKARDNYPAVKQYGLIAKAEAYNISNAAKGYLPQLALSAQATYQSDVTKLPFDEGLLAPLGIDIPTLGNPPIVPDCWIYVQDPGYKVGRLQIFNNWSPYLVKDVDDTVWIGLEYFCEEGDSFWSMSDEEARDFAIQELTRMRVINGPQDVIDAHRERVKKAYPAYFDTYSRMDELVEYLDSFGNLYCVGRNGQHRYNNMDHSMATAMEAVGNIKTGKTSKKNVWSVNTEQSYHESK